MLNLLLWCFNVTTNDDASELMIFEVRSLNVEHQQVWQLILMDCSFMFLRWKVLLASPWGHYFWPDYRALGCLKQNFPQVLVMALTTTATHSVRRDILDTLRIPHALVLETSFDGPNLNYEVQGKSKDTLKRLGKLLKDNLRTSVELCIVYQRANVLRFPIF